MTKENFANEDDLQWKMTSNGRLPQISKVRYLSNHWSDLPQISNFGLCDQSKLCKCFQWRWPWMEDDIKRKTSSDIKSGIFQQLLVVFSPNFKLMLMWPRQTLQMFRMKTTPHWGVLFPPFCNILIQQVSHWVIYVIRTIRKVFLFTEIIFFRVPKMI